MNWKRCIAAFVSLALTAFPQNIIGCGGTEDPHDYYTSFFSKETMEAKGYHPFYYTSLLTFYDEWGNWEKQTIKKDPVAEEWKSYFKKDMTTSQVSQFIYNFSINDLELLSGHIRKNQPARLASNLSSHPVTAYFIGSKDLAALDYLILAKKTEKISYVADAWSNLPKRDSLLLNRYIQSVQENYNKPVGSFLKDKFAFLRCKLAFYNNRHKDCINWFNESFASSGASKVYPLALSYKAGSLFRTGRSREAAYAFSRAFALDPLHRRSNFMGFLWSTRNCDPDLEADYLTQCKTDLERADMLGLFSLYGSSYRTPTLNKIYALDPSSSLLEVLSLREINKLEEQFLTPWLESEKGGMPFYYTWGSNYQVSTKDQQSVTELRAFFEQLATEAKAVNKGLYMAGAAYLSFMIRDFEKAKDWIRTAKASKLPAPLNDQVELISIMTRVNEKEKIDAQAEKELAASLVWLRNKAKEKPEYLTFYRNFFSQILAQKYYHQGDLFKTALAYGVADMSNLEQPTNSPFYSGYRNENGLDFIQFKLSTEQLQKLYMLETRADNSVFDKFLITNASFNRDQVIDVLGTSYLRDFDYDKAIEWLAKAKVSEKLAETYYNSLTERDDSVYVNPFHDYINDWQRYEKPLKQPYTKLSLARKLRDLENSIPAAKDNEAKSRIYYQLASAFYNMSYYGNAWNAVSYYRPTTKWYNGSHELAWEKEYFGVFKARAYYQKAYELTTNKEFKAAAFFLVAKCAQRQIPKPDYSYNDDWDQYRKKELEFEVKFRNNPLFEQFTKEFGSTQFYKFAYNRCSYLRDFKPGN